MQRAAPQNNLFYFAEAVAAEALFQSIGKKNDTASFNSLLDDLFGLSADFANFFDDVMGAMLEKFGKLAWIAPAEEIKLHSLQQFHAVRIPWFTLWETPSHDAG
jgi:hypothetical protein